MLGKASKRDVLTVKARIPPGSNYSPVVPVLIPDLSEVRAFARHLHAAADVGAWKRQGAGRVYGRPRYCEAGLAAPGRRELCRHGRAALFVSVKSVRQKSDDLSMVMYRLENK